MCKTKELWTNQSSSNANCFHFLESKICFALKQMQCLNNKFYCASLTFAPRKKCSIWSYKQTYFSVEKGNCHAPSISKYIRKRFGTGLAKEWTARSFKTAIYVTFVQRMRKDVRYYFESSLQFFLNQMIQSLCTAVLRFFCFSSQNFLSLECLWKIRFLLYIF